MTARHERRDVAITGVGPVSAIGSGADAFFAALCDGVSGIRTMDRCPPPRLGCTVAAQVDDLPAAPLDGADPMPRAVALARHAARLAWADAGMASGIDRDVVGVVVGSGIGNADLLGATATAIAEGKRLAPATAFRSFPHAAACEIASELDLRGPIMTVTSGCNAGADAIGLALDWLRLGRAEVVLVGGTEAELNPLFLGAMTAARALAVRHNDRPAAASRPFDVDRDGNVPGEGAGFLVLETHAHAARRHARVRAALRGYASRAAGRRPSYDPFQPALDPAPLQRTLRAALADADLAADALGAISANGSASVAYDPLEAAALRAVLGPAVADVPVHSIKGALGQTGAVTPALMAIAAALSIERGIVPPTINCDQLDPRVDLRIVRGAPLVRPVSSVLCNAIGFGGYYYSALVLGRP